MGGKTMTMQNFYMTDEEINKSYTFLYNDEEIGKERANQAFLILRITSLKSLKGFFSRAEIMALLEAFKNKSMFEYTPNIVENFSWDMKNAELYEGILTKRGVSVQFFMEKIAKMSPTDCFFLQEEIFRFWNVKGAYGKEEPEQQQFITSFS